MNDINKLTTIEKKPNRFIELFFLIYIVLVSCKNIPVFLYGGYVVLFALVVRDLLFTGTFAKLYLSKESMFMLLFAIYSFLSILWADNQYLAYDKMRFVLIAVFMVLFMVNYFCKINRVDYIIYTIACSGIALGLYVIIDYGGLRAFYDAATSASKRLGADVTNVNFIGMICSYSVITLFFLGLFLKKKWCYLLMVIPFVVSAASGSRKALAMMVIGILLVILFYQDSNEGVLKYLKVIFGIAIALLVFKYLLTLDIFQIVNERMDQLFAALRGDTRGADSSALARQEMIRIGWEQFSKTPFFGIGFANSLELNRLEFGVFTYSHNDYIEHLINGGIVGFLLYYGVLISLLVKHIKIVMRDKTPTIVISLIMLILFLGMNVGCVTYYGSLNTYTYIILWICVIEIHKKGKLQ